VNALDFDDTYIGHPGAVVIPSAMAIGETLHCNGRELITAIISGYEVLLRIGSAVYPSSTYEHTSYGHTWEIFGAVTAACKLLRLDGKAMASAMGIAGSAAPLPSDLKCSLNPLNKEVGMGMVKNNYGCMSELGVRAALLAHMGYTGPTDILDGDTGFWRMMGSDRCDFDEITAKLGEEYRILNVSLKPYSCCRRYHSYIDAALQIIRERKVAIEDVKEINVKISKSLMSSPKDDYEPKTMGSAIYSIPYSMAIAIKGLNPGPEWFKKENLDNPNILELAKKVRLLAYPNADRSGSRGDVEIILDGGGKYEKIVACPKGEPENPMTDRELKTKFKSLATRVINEQKVTKVVDVIEKLERVKDVANICDLLQP
jgi:2-methylcitrate dehydratase PrpD